MQPHMSNYAISMQYISKVEWKYLKFMQTDKIEK